MMSEESQMEKQFVSQAWLAIARCDNFTWERSMIVYIVGALAGFCWVFFNYATSSSRQRRSLYSSCSVTKGKHLLFPEEERNI